MKIKDIVLEEKKKNLENKENIKNFLDEVATIKEYLEKKQMDLYVHLKKWDFQKNGTIKYRNLKDSISVKFYDFEANVRNLILNFAAKVLNDLFLIIRLPPEFLPVSGLSVK